MLGSLRHISMRMYHSFCNPHSASGRFVVRQKLINGYRILVSVNEDVGCQIYCYGAFEKDETDLIGRIIKENSVCLDIGANVGYYTLLMASKARKGKVHSFEPIARNYHLMCTSVLVNGFTNVVLNCCAVGNIDADMSFVASEDSGYSSFIDTGRKSIANIITVPVKTLDSYCKEYCLDRIDFIKVDAEGAERMVLEGSRRLLKDVRRRPRVMMLELYEPMLQKYSTNIDEVVDNMKGLSYLAFVPTKGGIMRFEKRDYNRFYNVFFAEDRDLLK